MRQIILASQSIRRYELLKQMGVEFEVVPSDFVERLDESRSPETIAEELGEGKATAVAKLHPGAIVIGSDEIVVVENQQLGKPGNIVEARDMLHMATRAPNKIVTSVAVLCLEENYRFVASEIAFVFLKPYNPIIVEAYLKTGDSLDKAGGYGFQSGATPLIDHIEGNLDVVVGLPTHLLAPVLQQLGYTARSVEYPVPEGLVVKKLNV